MTEIYFAQIREDSLVEREVALKVRPEKILYIGSGGCTAFSLLTDSVKNVYCIDSNAAQCALIELKKAAIENLNREEYLQFIGEQPSPDRKRIFNSIMNHLSPEVMEYWLKHEAYIEMGINRCGATERFYRYISDNIANFLPGEETWRKLFECKSLEEQKEFYEIHFRTESWVTGITILLSKATHLLFFPSSMFAYAGTNDFSSFFLSQFEKEMQTRRVVNNYFLSQLIFSKYLNKEVEGMPFYLSHRGYDVRKKNIHKLSVQHSDLKKACKNLKGIDCFMLSNVFDWANEKEREEICKGMVACSSSSSSVLYRNMFASVDLNKYFLNSFQEDKEYSRVLYGKERSMMYSKITFMHL
jgi:S-adenosylmethionine:diacylglycerol 3-amino-3-carboxypropyl transferase